MVAGVRRLRWFSLPTVAHCARQYPWPQYLAGCGAAAVLQASADSGLLLLDAPPSRATLAVGVSAYQIPRYPGAHNDRQFVLPAVEWLGASGLFASTNLGLGWNLSDRKDVQWGVRLWPQLARRQGDGARLQGLSEIPARLERSLFANWEPVEFAVVQSAVNTGLGPDTRGILAEAGVTLGAPLGSQVLAGVTIGTSYANGPYRQGLFGVTPAQAAGAGNAAIPGLPVMRQPYALGGGWQNTQAIVSAEWTMAPAWRLDLHWERQRLLGAAAQSPLIDTRWQSSLLLTLWHDLAY